LANGNIGLMVIADEQQLNCESSDFAHLGELLVSKMSGIGVQRVR
jgi:hypothetical protein